MDGTSCTGVPCGTAPSPPPISEEGGRQALLAHAAGVGAAIRERYGSLDYTALERLLRDPDAVRFPVSIAYDAGPLEGEELAYPLAADDDPTNGFTMYVHPHYRNNPVETVAVVLYALVVVNYGEAASGEVGEIFGAAALGMERQEYYEHICRLADSLPR